MMVRVKSQMKKVCTSNPLSLVNVNKIIIEKKMSVVISVNMKEMH